MVLCAHEMIDILHISVVNKSIMRASITHALFKELIRHEGPQTTYKLVQPHPFQPAEHRAFMEHAYEAHVSRLPHL